MTATAFYRHARIAGGFKLSLSVHIRKGDLNTFDGRLFGTRQITFVRPRDQVLGS